MNVKEKLQALLTASNATTGETDTTLTDAVRRLVDGYGQGGGGGLFDATYQDFVVASTTANWFDVVDLCLPDIGQQVYTGTLANDMVYVIELINSVGSYANSDYQMLNPWFCYAASATNFQMIVNRMRKASTTAFMPGAMGYPQQGGTPASRPVIVNAGSTIRLWTINAKGAIK